MKFCRMRNRIHTAFLLLFLFIISTRISFAQEETQKERYNVILLQDTTLAVEYFKKGWSLYEAAQYDSSNKYYSKAKDIYEELSKQYDQENTWVHLIQCSNMLGWILKLQGKYETSIQHLTFAIDIGLKKLGENHVDVAQSYNCIGSTYSSKGDYDKALEYFIKSLSIRYQLLGENSPQLAGNYNNIATIYLEKGDYNQALEYLQKALSIRRQALKKEDIEIAQYYNNIGIVYKGKGDYDKALEFYQKSLSIKLRTLGEEHILVANNYNNIGTIYSYKDDFDQAIKYYEKSLSIRIKLLGENHQDVAGSYINMGIIYWKKGDYDKALEIHQKSLTILLRLFGEDNNLVAQNYMYIGKTYNDKGDYDKALEYTQKSLSIRHRLFGEKNPDVAESYLNLAKIYERKQDFAVSLNYCQSSIIALVSQFKDQSIYNNPPLEGINSESYLLDALKLKAKIFSRISNQNKNSSELAKTNLETSLLTYQLVTELIDKMRTGYKAEGSKLFLGEQVSEIYDQAIRTSLKLYDITKAEKYKQQAFLFAEKGKSAVLHEGLMEVNAIQFAKLPSYLLEKEKQLKVDLAFYETQLQNEYQKPVSPTARQGGKDSQDNIKISDYENRLFDLKNQYEKLISDLESNYPDYFNLKYQNRNVSVPEIQENLSGNTALIEYFVTDSTIFVFTILKDEFDVVPIKKPIDFSLLTKDFYSSIIKTETEKYITSANELSKLLITPVMDKIRVKEKLVIIPHDLLFKIPFETLFTSSQKKKITDYSKIDYLIKTFDVSYHYSSSLYIRSIKKRMETNKNNLEKSFIGFAPVFAKDDLSGYTLAGNDLANLTTDYNELLRSTIVDGKRFDELKYSEWEVKSIFELFAAQKKNKNNSAYFYSDATEEAFKSSVNNYNIIHIASHSFINEIHPQISGVVFAQPIDTSFSEDGILYAGETYNLELNAGLVVLSSCESGLGKLVRGEGMMALTRGFLYSGADNIIFSLWKIPDKHTSELMIEFYKQMLAGKSYSESLKKAKLTLIKNESTARPRSWASFVLIGSD